MFHFRIEIVFALFQNSNFRLFEYLHSFEMMFHLGGSGSALFEHEHSIKIILMQIIIDRICFFFILVTPEIL